MLRSGTLVQLNVLVSYLRGVCPRCRSPYSSDLWPPSLLSFLPLPAAQTGRVVSKKMFESNHKKVQYKACFRSRFCINFNTMTYKDMKPNDTVVITQNACIRLASTSQCRRFSGIAASPDLRSKMCS